MKQTVKQQWLNIKDACTYAGVCRDTFLSWMNDGLKSSKVGKCHRIKTTNIDEYLERYEGKQIDMDDLEKKVMAGLRGLKITPVARKKDVLNNGKSKPRNNIKT